MLFLSSYRNDIKKTGDCRRIPYHSCSLEFIFCCRLLHLASDLYSSTICLHGWNISRRSMQKILSRKLLRCNCLLVSYLILVQNHFIWFGLCLQYDPKLTTPPGLYIITMAVLYPLSMLFQVDLCTLNSFRLFNVFVSLLNLILLYKIIDLQVMIIFM